MDQWQIIVAIYIATNLMTMIIINHSDPMWDGTARKKIVLLDIVIYAIVLIPFLLIIKVLQVLRFLSRIK